MAVYYKWIKGCAVGATLETGLWTYLKWGGNANSVNNADGSAGKTTDNLPHIYAYIGKKDNPTNENDLGYVLTNAAEGIDLTKPWKLSGDFYFNLNSHSNDNNLFLSNSCGNIKLINNGYYFEKNLTVNGTTILNSTLSVNNKTTLKSQLEVNSTTTLKGIVSIENTTNATSTETGALKVSGGIGVGGAIYSGSSCTAVYFNATSDKRAKENIRLANYSALDLIKKLPVYIYNYKNSNETVTGILAQDLLEVQPKELNLVSNINATGENNDYMSIKNDKLMFVLMKAIQEQQEQIEQLKSEIDNIKKSY